MNEMWILAVILSTNKTIILFLQQGLMCVFFLFKVLLTEVLLKTETFLQEEATVILF